MNAVAVHAGISIGWMGLPFSTNDSDSETSVS